ncbi:hypothetical protein MC885_006827, partial [Smutsia gigantea]
HGLSQPTVASRYLGCASCVNFWESCKEKPGGSTDGHVQTWPPPLCQQHGLVWFPWNSMKVMFKCLWKNCGKVLSTAAGIQKHIRTVHLGTPNFPQACVSISSTQQPVAAQPAFYWTGNSSRTETPCAKTETKLMTPLSRSAPTTLYLVHTDHAYQATPPVTIPGSAKFTPNGSSFSISWQSPPVTFTGIPVSPTHSHPVGTGEQRQHTNVVLSSPPRGTLSLRKPRGEGRKCRKVYGMEHRDMWCTACRWKKACQRFTD